MLISKGAVPDCIPTSNAGMINKKKIAAYKRLLLFFLKKNIILCYDTIQSLSCMRFQLFCSALNETVLISHFYPFRPLRNDFLHLHDTGRSDHPRLTNQSMFTTSQRHVHQSARPLLVQRCSPQPRWIIQRTVRIVLLQENDEHLYVILVDYEDHVSINIGRKWKKINSQY